MRGRLNVNSSLAARVSDIDIGAWLSLSCWLSWFRDTLREEAKLIGKKPQKASCKRGPQNFNLMH